MAKPGRPEIRPDPFVVETHIGNRRREGREIFPDDVEALSKSCCRKKLPTLDYADACIASPSTWLTPS